MSTYYGYKQNAGGFSYYYSGFKEQSRKRPKEDDLNKPDANVTEKVDEGDPNANVEKSAAAPKQVQMENIELKKKDPKDEQVVGSKMELQEN